MGARNGFVRWALEIQLQGIAEGANEASGGERGVHLKQRYKGVAVERSDGGKQIAHQLAKGVRRRLDAWAVKKARHGELWQR